MGRRLLVGMAVAVAAVLAAGFGIQAYLEPGTGTEVASGRRILPAASPELAGAEVVWAHRARLHVDDTRIDLGRGRAEELTGSPYGVFVRTVPRGPGPSRWLYATADGVAEVPGRPGAIAVSVDGRYAGWVDRDGPDVPMGPRAELVVVDLETGAETLRSGAGMGDVGDDLADLYSELDPQVLGFEGAGEDLVVVYRNAEGSGETTGLRVATGRRADVSARPEDAGDLGLLEPDSLPAWAFAPGTGAEIAVDRGRPAGGGLSARLAPDRTALVRTGTRRVRVFTVPGARDVTPTLPAGSTRLGAFLPDGDLLLVHERRRTPTVLLRCAVGGDCREVGRAVGEVAVAVPAY